MDRPIVKLPDSTIQMIAAGEVITSPYNVVKELIENSIDAGASNIRVLIEQGGSHLIEVTDNGHGISKSNAQLLCKRYTTSKIRQANDLSELKTFGFRGEALSSITEVADIQVSSFNMKTDKMGWSASYHKGDVHGSVSDKYTQISGTQIKAFNLFHYLLLRKRTVESAFLESKWTISDMITKYAIHHRATITFCLSDRASGTVTDLVCSIAPMEMKPSLGSFYGLEIENNFMEFSVKDSGNFPGEAYIALSYKKASSNVNTVKSMIFVNDRLVENAEFQREMAAVMLEFLNIKQYFFVFYLALNVPPSDVDANTHPAKETVALRYQKEILEEIVRAMRNSLQQNLSSRIIVNKISTQRSIGDLLKSSSASQSIENSNSVSSQGREDRLRKLAPGCFSQEKLKMSTSQSSTPVKRSYDSVHNDAHQKSLDQMKIAPVRPRRELKLRSLYELREQVAHDKAETSTDIIKKSVFVGIFDHEHALVQYETKLYAINFRAFLKELCYQFYLFDFGNFPPITIEPPGNKIEPIIEIHLEDMMKHQADEFEKLVYKTPQDVVNKLQTHSPMLQDYLNLQFNDETISIIPNIIPDHIPNMVYLGKFLIEMANKVDFSSEKECFHMMGRLVGDFYSEPPANLKNARKHKEYHDFIEMRLYDAIKRYLIVPEWLLTKINICQITDTKDLYKVFERC